MSAQFVLVLFVNTFVLLLGVSVGRSIIRLKMRKEENRKRELELELLERRSTVLRAGKKTPNNLEELLYKARIQNEIDEIIRNKDAS